ncbi:MAG: UvrD-helicase domain-containing protein [Bacteroidales bacterium]|nr:UvrD-helicase domain-containing protein [Bacteroidales bacterium]
MMTKEQRNALLNPVRENGGVEVMKASAGSGKTYALAREYIRLLLQDRDKDEDGHPYRHILAVTFTNKATGEMKSRIIDALHTLAYYTEHSTYLDYLKEKCGISSNEEIARECEKALKAILYDYSAFSVSTIDKFFQRVLRAFAREAGQFAEYQVELDRDQLVSETVDRVLDSLSEADGDLLEWLSSNSVESIAQGDGYKLSDTLGTFADGYMSEGYREKAEALGLDKEKAFSAENLKRLKDICSKICRSYETGLRREAEAALALAKAEKKPAKYLVDRLNSIVNDGPDAAKDVFGDTKEYWVKGIERGIVDKVNAYSGERWVQYNTARILRGQIAVFRMADALDREFNALLEEKNVLGLDDTNAILRDIIAGSDAPFVYEKVGVRYRHFLLDEFQDTSSTQWDNFKPLLMNSIGTGCYNLIVGDVKQSIYRWRNAKWDILDSRVQDELDRTVSNPLETNWRSAEKIVKFNNAFYKTWSQKLDAQLGAEIAGSEAAEEAASKSISDIYADVEQKWSDKIPVPGSVELTFCDGNDLYDKTIEAVIKAEERGFLPKDIAVIVRTNAIGQEVASRLTAIGRHVITNDSLRICSGKTVRALVSRLYKIDNPEDKINTFYAGDFNYTPTDSCKSLVDLCEHLLAEFPAKEVNSDTLYVLAFMDLVRDFASKNGNSLHAFLEYWSEDGMKKSIASPDGTDAITVITIHSVKGLDYPCVILPLQKKESWISSYSKFWEAPDTEGSPFEAVEPALYNTGLSSSSLNTHFAGNYMRELRMSYIDEVNVWYVATTRASQAMHIIGIKPTKDQINRSPDAPWVKFAGITGALYQFCNDTASGFVKDGDAPEDGKFCEHYLYGTLSGRAERKKDDWEKPMPPVTKVELKFYPKEEMPKDDNPLNLRLKTDSADFFDPEGEINVKDLRRLRGTVLHGILETVWGPEDLAGSVRKAVEDGLLSAEEAVDAEQMLNEAIAHILERGWFPGDKSKLLNERDLILPSGESRRPDRVVLKDDGSVEIVDYKFAAENDAYVGQVQDYVAYYKAMGYKDVRGYLWYVDRDYISEV